MKRWVGLIWGYAALASAAAGGDWWYALYEGDAHVGYCHIVESTATLGGAAVKRVTFVVEAKKDKTGQYQLKRTEDRYRNDAGLVYYSSKTVYKGATTDVKSAKGTKGFTVTITRSEKEGKEPKVENVEVPAESYNFIEIEEAVAKLTGPGTRVDVIALDPASGKVAKGKVEYVADQTIEVAGAAVETKVVAGKGVLNGSTYWLDRGDGSLLKFEGDAGYGKVKLVRVASAAAAYPR